MCMSICDCMCQCVWVSMGARVRGGCLRLSMCGSVSGAWCECICKWLGVYGCVSGECL